MSLRLEHVNYIYGLGSGYEKQALRDVSLEIHHGQFVGIVGHTGSGKSTLVQILNGLEKPSSGEVFYNKKSVTKGEISGKELRSKVGLVFQYPEYQLFETSVIKDVEFGPRNLGLPNLEVQKRAFEALKMTGIGDELLDASPHLLSGGEKRRVAIAGVLAMKPEVLILDEPTAGLDPRGREELLTLLEEIHHEEEVTIILVSHSMEEVARYADRVLVMNSGHIVLDGEPAAIFRYEEELRQIGLGVPQSTRVMHLLQQRGLAVQGEVLTPQEAADRIDGMLRQVEK